MNDDILPRLATGAAEAAEECLDRYGALVWSLARRHLRSPADAEDAVQEIFLSIWKNAERFDPGKASEVAFISMIARRRLIDLYRYKERRPESSFAENEMESLPDRQSSQIEAKAEAVLASRAMKELRSEEREAIRLSIYQGMSHSEISRRMELPLGTVKTYIRRGLNQVRELLTGNDGP